MKTSQEVCMYIQNFIHGLQFRKRPPFQANDINT